MGEHRQTGPEQRLAALERTVQDLQAVVEQQARHIDSLERTQATATPRAAAPAAEDASPSVAPQAAPAGRRGIDRRRLLLGGATATAAAAVAVVAGATPAAAANGGNLILGQSNDATAATTLAYGGSSTNGFKVSGNSTQALIESTQAGDGAAILGTGPNYGVRGVSASTGVIGLSTGGGEGVQGYAEDGKGVEGYAEDGTGVRGFSPNGIGVDAGSNNNVAVRASGPTSLYLESYTDRPAPILDSGSHARGEIVITGTGGELWLCVAGGTPGTWRKLGGSTTAGQFHVLPTPVRIYDSRPGSSPAQGPKTKLSGNASRVIDCTHNSSTVPKGATAVSLTVLLVNAANGNGTLTVWQNGAARPAANTAVWGEGSGRYTTTAICALDADAKLRVAASVSTDLVLDVVGYYR